MSDFIEKYLDRFKDSLKQAQFRKEEIIEIIKKETGITVKKESLEVKDHVLYLKTKPIFRSEIIMKKKRVLEKLSSLGVVDMR